MKAKVTYSLYLEPVTEQEIHQLVSSLKKSSPGYDNLGASILQIGLPEICPVLTYICNLSLMEGISPDELNWQMSYLFLNVVIMNLLINIDIFADDTHFFPVEMICLLLVNCYLRSLLNCLYGLKSIDYLLT